MSNRRSFLKTLAAVAIAPWGMLTRKKAIVHDEPIKLDVWKSVKVDPPFEPSEYMPDGLPKNSYCYYDYKIGPNGPVECKRVWINGQEIKEQS